MNPEYDEINEQFYGIAEQLEDPPADKTWIGALLCLAAGAVFILAIIGAVDVVRFALR